MYVCILSRVIRGWTGGGEGAYGDGPEKQPNHHWVAPPILAEQLSPSVSVIRKIVGVAQPQEGRMKQAGTSGSAAPASVRLGGGEGASGDGPEVKRDVARQVEFRNKSEILNLQSEIPCLPAIACHTHPPTIYWQVPKKNAC